MKVEIIFKQRGQEHKVYEQWSHFDRYLWRKEMRTYTVECRVDFVDEEKYDIFLEMARTMARDLMASALMLKDKRDPQVMFTKSDMFSKDEDMELITPEDATPRGE